MTTLRGDICPSWCGGDHHENRFQPDGRPLHPDDWGVTHHSSPVDEWHPLFGEHGERDREPLKVWVEGTRHDFDDDWPDEIRAVNVHPGFMSDLGLQVPDARRLGEALLSACDLAEGRTGRALM